MTEVKTLTTFKILSNVHTTTQTSLHEVLDSRAWRLSRIHCPEKCFSRWAQISFRLKIQVTKNVNVSTNQLYQSNLNLEQSVDHRSSQVLHIRTHTTWIVGIGVCMLSTTAYTYDTGGCYTIFISLHVVIVGIGTYMQLIQRRYKLRVVNTAYTYR